MGLMTGALQIGRSALMAYQSALQVVGSNISNAGTDGYVRQTPILTPGGGVFLPEGFLPGGGVSLTNLKRNVDEALQARLRGAVGEESAALAEQETLARVETILNELSESDLSTLLQEFFNSFSDLQNNPTDAGTRSVVLTAGNSIASELHRQRHDVLALLGELNQDIEGAAKRADEIAEEIAGLNVRIVELEASNAGSANALRDQRDQLLTELSELIQIEVREQPDGSFNVYVGNEPLVQAGMSRGLITTPENVDGYPRMVVRFADNNGPIDLLGGRIAGLVTARDAHVIGHVEVLDDFAASLINEVNKIHAQGQGLEGYADVTGAFDVLDATAVLNSSDAGLDLTPQNGSFLITVTDTAAGTSVTTTITVDLDGAGTDDSLQSLVDQINANVAHVTASVTADNRFRLVADAGMEITFGEDTSHVLAALGVNAFFTGDGADDIDVSAVLAANPQLLAAATQNAPGDGSNASRLAGLATESLASLQGQSLTDAYNKIASNVAVKGSAAMAAVEASNGIKMSLTAQRESVSGVNLDEEAISLLKLERSFQAAARYAATVDALIQEMLQLVG